MTNSSITTAVGAAIREYAWRSIHGIHAIQWTKIDHERAGPLSTTIRRSGNSFVIRVPREEMERIGIQEGEHVPVEIRALDMRPRLAVDLRASVDTEIARSARAFDRLARA